MMCLGEIIGINNRLSKPMSILEIKISQYHQSKLIVIVRVDHICNEVIERVKRTLQVKYDIPLTIEKKQATMVAELLKSLLEKTLSPIILVINDKQTLVLCPKTY